MKGDLRPGVDGLQWLECVVVLVGVGVVVLVEIDVMVLVVLSVVVLVGAMVLV